MNNSLKQNSLRRDFEDMKREFLSDFRENYFTRLDDLQAELRGAYATIAAKDRQLKELQTIVANQVCSP